MHSVLAVDRSTQDAKRSSLSEDFVQVRRTTERLCSPLSAEDQMVQSMPDASPAKWHQAHTSWFFETFILLQHAKNYRPLDQHYTYFFNSYYKQLGGHPIRAQRGLWSRPSLQQVQEYRQHIDHEMLRLLDGNVAEDVAALVVLGLNHEQQHQELILTDIKHALWTNPLRPAYRERQSKPNEDATALQWIEFPGGEQVVGFAGDGFSFDNETPRHRVLLTDYKLASRLTTNGEYMEFMADGGYTRPELWLSDGWDAVCANGWRSPLYWEERDGAWHIFTLNGDRPVDPAEPVCHVSFYEADAYARWAGARLATEFEWEIATGRPGLVDSLGREAVRGETVDNLLDSDVLHPTALKASKTSSGKLAQMFGDVWEWTSSPYVSYPGFRSAAGALGEYNGKFMCNQLVLRGGSCATPASHIRASYRNFFPPHARWQFSGIRLAHD